MAERTLKLKLDGDSSGLAAASKDASATLERFEKSAEKAGTRMERVGTNAEGLADSSSLATGALGALASGFELAGFEGAAESLQKASMATDFFSGVGDTATLVTQKLGLAKLRDTVATRFGTKATKAKTAATKAATAAQKALNVVMRANPIGIVITLIAGLVGLLVLAYKKSDTFRRIVDKAFSVVSNSAQALVGWVRKNFPAVFGFIAGPFTAAKEFVTDKLTGLIEWLRNAPGKVTNAVSGLWDGIGEGFRSTLNRIIGWWNDFSLSVNIPNAIPGLPNSFTINTPNMGYLAAGGYAAPGRTYLVGENGPEILTMGGRGFVTPNNRLEGSTGGDLQSMARELLDLLAQLMQSEIRQSRRGVVRSALAGRGNN